MAKINPIDLQNSLKGVDYPALKDDIAKEAKRNGADDLVLESLMSMDVTTFETPAEVIRALGEEM